MLRRKITVSTGKKDVALIRLQHIICMIRQAAFVKSENRMIQVRRKIFFLYSEYFYHIPSSLRHHTAEFIRTLSFPEDEVCLQLL